MAMHPLIQMHRWFETVATIVLGMFLVGMIGYHWLRRTEDARLLVFKWFLTALTLAFGIWQTGVYKNAPASGFDVFIVGICSIAMIAIWRRNIANVVANPFGALFDGGDTEIEPQPFYSVAESKRKLGRYTEAVEEIRKQLERFPTDFHGQLMLAEILAENLNDLPGAELTIQRLLSQPGHAPRNIVHVLTLLADWYLKYNVDTEMARRYFDEIIERFPETEFALTAEQRIAHLGNAETRLSPFDRKTYVVKEGVKNLGLLIERKAPGEAGPAEDPAKLVEDYVNHLETYPRDFEVREKLATIYASHYQRLDLATDQLEQMIAAPGQPARNITRWLNQLADLQVRCGAELAATQATLQRIVDGFPDSPAAQVALTRLGQLKLEFKALEKTAGIKMGVYEQNIGLKRDRIRPG